MNAREVALKAIYDIDINGTYTNAALLKALENGELNAQDKAFVTELIYGVVANKSAVDYIVSKYSKLKLKKLSPWVLNILRMGIYQIYYMDRIPVSAACNESVKLANRYAHRAASGFVNGVLRAFSKDAENFEFPVDGDAAENLSLKYSYPVWLTQKLVDEYGEEVCRKFFEENTKAHGVFVRANLLKNSVDELCEILKNEGVVCEKNDVEGCVLVKGKLSIEKSKAYAEGRYSLQNISSQKAVIALNPKAGDTVIDMCAAPGGKSCAAAERMKNQGRVFSFDIYEHKIDLIQKSAKRLGIDIISAEVCDATKKRKELCHTADCVLADVPCSGFGVLHKKPDIKWKRTEADIKELCMMQSEILETAASYVKEGGTLVYSTCTVLPEENRIQTEKFIEKYTEFSIVSEEQILTGIDGESGFYICKMLKG